jgi:hypothetical protein
MRSRYSRLPEAVAIQDGRVSQGRGACVDHVKVQRRRSAVHGHQGSGIKRTPSPIASHRCGTWKPRCGLCGMRIIRCLSQSATRKDGPSPQRDRKAQQANVARRKARGIHNPANRATDCRGATHLARGLTWAW